MSPLIPGVAGALVVAGILGLIAGLRPVPLEVPGPRRRSHRRWVRRWRATSATMRVLLVISVVAGVVIAVTTGWLIAVVVLPGAVVGLPLLLSTPPAATRIDKLDALEEWTRALAGVLTVGAGLDQALMATMRSTPEAIRPAVSQLTRRLAARVPTETALKAFADDLDDPTGDLVAANLILGARRRGSGLAAVLESLAESVAADVRSRRAIEADRAKPRTTARLVTIITVGALSVLALTGGYIAPYATPVGQVLLAVLLAAYVGCLVWMRAMSAGEPLPRFIGVSAAAGAQR